MKENLLVIAAALFIVFFLVQLLRGMFFSRRSWKSGTTKGNPELDSLLAQADSPLAARNVLRDIDARAVQGNADTRALYYSLAGEIALTRLKRPNVAIRYYYRALRNNPGCEQAFDRLSEVLLAQKRFRRFKRTCWHILARMDDGDTGGPIWKKCWSGLATVYASTPGTIQRADAIRKMLSGFDSEGADEVLRDLDDLDDDGDAGEGMDGKCRHFPKVG